MAILSMHCSWKCSSSSWRKEKRGSCRGNENWANDQQTFAWAVSWAGAVGNSADGWTGNCKTVNCWSLTENFTDRMTLSRVHRHIRCFREWMPLSMWACLTRASILQLLWKVNKIAHLNNSLLPAAVSSCKTVWQYFSLNAWFDVLKMSWNFTVFLSWKKLLCSGLQVL